MSEEKLKNLKEIRETGSDCCTGGYAHEGGSICEICLKQAGISHIKHMRKADRDFYWSNIDEKSVIPWIKDFFDIDEEDINGNKISNN